MISGASEKELELANARADILLLGLESQLKQVDNYYEKEIERLNNIRNELKEWFKGYHKSYASCKWYEEDYIEFIEHLENELKGSDK